MTFKANAHPVAQDSPRPTTSTSSPLEASVGGEAEEARLPELGALEQSRINETLLRIGAALSSELELDPLVQKLTDEATTLCRAQFGALFYNVVSEAGESYTLYTLSGVPREAFTKFPMPRNTAVFGPTFEGTGVVRSDDVTADPRYGKNAPYHGMPTGHLPVRSYLAVPVKSRSGEVLGGLFFGHSEVGVFKAADERLLVAVSAQAGIALDNAKLFQAARRAEASAERERARLRELFMQSPALIVIVRGPTHVYEFVNAAASKLLGREDTIGKPLRDVFPDIADEQVRIFDHVFETGERYVDEAVAAVRDWTGDQSPGERFFNVTYEPYREADGRVAGVMFFGFEVTEQVLARRKVEAVAEALEVANRAKDEFLATVSHELRTPLNAILGWVRMFRGGSLSEEKRTRALETIERNATVQTKLVEELLDVSRIITGKLRLDVGKVDVCSVVESGIEAVHPAATAKRIDLQQSLVPLDAPIHGDPQRLQQVVWNLLTNAIKFTPEGGTVRVAVCNRRSSVEIVVSDTGQGIAPECVPHVFERFWQADGTTERKFGGLGLGLAIVRYLVELHGGTVKVDSDGLGKGATFTVSIPLAPVQSREADPSSEPHLVSGSNVAPPGKLEGVRILVVDDERDARDLVAEILAGRKATVWTAASAREALRLVAQHRPDVLVSDIGMPGEDGYALIKRLRSLPTAAGGQTPAVALTAYARVEDKTKALGAGFDVHLPKPVEPSRLLDALSSLATTQTRH